MEEKDFCYFGNKRFFKVLNAANYKNGYEYEDGLNDMSNVIGADGEPFVCFFTDIKHIFAYLDYGPCFREVFIPDNMPIIFEAGESFGPGYPYIPGYYSRKVILGEVMPWTVNNIKYLIENVADISVNKYNIVKWALMYNFEVFYYLQEYIYDKDPSIWDAIINDLQLRGFL